MTTFVRTIAAVALLGAAYLAITIANAQGAPARLAEPVPVHAATTG